MFIPHREYMHFDQSSHPLGPFESDPAGTGASMAKIREVAVKRDKMILDEREKQQSVVSPAPEAELPALPPAE